MHLILVNKTISSSVDQGEKSLRQGACHLFCKSDSGYYSRNYYLLLPRMKSKQHIKLNLTDIEKANLRKHKIKMANILDFAPDELEVLLNVTSNRAKEIYALVIFQTIPSIGIKFAEDLIFLGYYTLNELKNKDGAILTDEYEQKKGYWVDPCVEDQFRLVVNFANTNDSTKTWWDFTEERKKFRITYGYPKNRPQKSWVEIAEYEQTKIH